MNSGEEHMVCLGKVSVEGRPRQPEATLLPDLADSGLGKLIGQVSSPGPRTYAEELTDREMVGSCLLPALCPGNLVP